MSFVGRHHIKVKSYEHFLVIKGAMSKAKIPMKDPTMVRESQRQDHWIRGNNHCQNWESYPPFITIEDGWWDWDSSFATVHSKKISIDDLFEVDYANPPCLEKDPYLEKDPKEKGYKLPSGCVFRKGNDIIVTNHSKHMVHIKIV